MIGFSWQSISRHFLKDAVYIMTQVIKDLSRYDFTLCMGWEKRCGMLDLDSIFCARCQVCDRKIHLMKTPVFVCEAADRKRSETCHQTSINIFPERQSLDIGKSCKVVRKDIWIVHLQTSSRRAIWQWTTLGNVSRTARLNAKDKAVFGC